MCTTGTTVHVNLAAVKLIGSLDRHKPLSYVATQYKCTYTCTYIHVHIYTYTHVHIYTYIHVYIYTYIHVHIDTYTHVCTLKPMHITHMRCACRLQI